MAKVSFWASELDEHNWGWKIIDGTCAGRAFKFGRRGAKQCMARTQFAAE